MRRRALVLLLVVLVAGIALAHYHHSTHAVLKPCNIAPKVSAMVNGAQVDADC